MAGKFADLDGRDGPFRRFRQGLAGRGGQGLNAVGKAYDYTPHPREKGKRVIVEAEASVVRRIFEEYVEGRTLREIVHDLNFETISPPRGRSWNASTINGNLQRGTVIIQNELYAGRLVWNKVRMIKDADTDKRLSRPNAKSNWQTTEVPDLRGIPQALFDAAQNRKKARGQTLPNQQRRPRHMLSGLLRCGSCAAGMSTSGRDKSRRIRIRCSAATESGSCRDPKTSYLASVESAVLSGLEAEMQHPSVIAEYARTYCDERKRLAAKSNAKRARLELRLGEINGEIDRLVDAIAKGHGDAAVPGPRSSRLDEERKEITQDLGVEPTASDVISLHPAVLARYERQLLQLQDSLSKGITAGDSEATEAIRDLVETVTVFRDPERPGGVTVEIGGRLTALLHGPVFPTNVRGVLQKW